MIQCLVETTERRVGHLIKARDLQEEIDGVNDMGTTVIEENVVTATGRSSWCPSPRSSA